MTTTKRTPLKIPDDLPWKQNVGLLLDAVQVENLLPKLFAWDCTVKVEPLYLQTRFAQLRDFSPCLVRVRSPSDPVIIEFLAHADEHWGYLVCSEAPWAEMVAHLRWLASIKHPSGAEMLLRIADPAVARALLGDTQTSTVTLFGTCQQVVVINPASNGWDYFIRHSEAPSADHSALYQMSEHQWSLLESASFSKMVSELYQHMSEFFPEYQSTLTAHERWDHLYRLAKRAAAYGHDSEADIWLYANAHGLLGDQVMGEDPEILQLLAPEQPSPERRMQLISSLAERKCFP